MRWPATIHSAIAPVRISHVTHKFTIIESWIFFLIPPQLRKITVPGFLKVNSAYNQLQWFFDFRDGEDDIIEERRLETDIFRFSERLKSTGNSGKRSQDDRKLFRCNLRLLSVNGTPASTSDYLSILDPTKPFHKIRQPSQQRPQLDEICRPSF